MPPQLSTFVLPGLDIARANGLDVEAAGLRPVATPRHAMVLLIVGELPARLREPAAVTYTQMPRPRMIVALDSTEVFPLPSPDALGALSQHGLEGAVASTRKLLRSSAWARRTEPFETDVLLPESQRRARRSSGQNVDVEVSDRDGMAHGGIGHGGMVHGGMNHGEMDHGGMDHDGAMAMGFMSMVGLTQHLPKSSDGLPMERVWAPFGPFFPGLPAGLELTLWLDGDTVARVEVPEAARTESSESKSGATQRLAGDLTGLADRLATLDPLTPTAYRRLAELAQGSDRAEEAGAAVRHLIEVETERAASHLNWLAGFGYLLGYSWLSQRAAQWNLALRRHPDHESVAALEPKLLGFLRRVRRAPLLASRLRGIGRLLPAELAGVSGPIARASGLDLDVRLDDPLYRSLGFNTALRSEGDALARLLLRVDEVGESLRLIRMAGRLTTSAGSTEGLTVYAAAGGASVETARGTARLRTYGDDSKGAEAHVYTPSAASIALIGKVAVGLELADALVAIASLDISPFAAQP